MHQYWFEYLCRVTLRRGGDHRGELRHRDDHGEGEVPGGAVPIDSITPESEARLVSAIETTM
jgi:hypothetical protein